MENITHLYEYCERMGEVGFWAEPLNALSNVAFLLSGLLALRLCWGLKIRQYMDIYALCVILMLIGLGSAAWHFAPSDETLMMDIIPIAIFINLYMAVLLRRGFGWNLAYIAFSFAILYKLNMVTEQSFEKSTLNGSIFYVPTWLMLALLCIVASYRRLKFAKTLVRISALWTVSIAFRTVDNYICGYIPFGTHFLWHICNAIVLFQLIKLLLTYCTRK